MQNLVVPSGLGTRVIGEDHGELLGWIIQSFSVSFTHHSTVSHFCSRRWYIRVLIGSAESVLISASGREVATLTGVSLLEKTEYSLRS